MNGFCSMPEECQCFEGYNVSETNKFMCNPICEPNCINGFCEEPNSCVCQEGYRLDDDGYSCLKNCSNECVYGNCSNGFCVCEDGWSGSSCNRSNADIVAEFLKERYNNSVSI